MNRPGAADSFSQWMIRRAARLAPPALAARLEEEWLADLMQRRTPRARLGLALGCLWAMRVITHEHPLPRLAAAGPAPTAQLATPARRAPALPPRVLALFFIAALHAGALYVLATGLLHTTAAPAPTATAADFVTEHARAELPTPPPPPDLRPAQVEIPPADLNVDEPADGMAISTAPPPEAGPTAPVSAPRAIHLEQGGPAARFPNTADYYPPISRRMGESGAATIEVCVDAGGRLTADPTLAASSGSVRLDTAALRLAKAGSGHYVPTREDGRPVSACYPFRVRFALDE